MMMDNQMHKRQQQPRSNSIGGQEFGLGGHQRLKQSIYTHQNPYVDANQYYSQRARYNSNYFQQNAPSDRSLSPMSLGGRASEFHVAQRADSIKYSSDREQKNHLHASLECLNVIYSDYGRNQKQQQPQQPLVHNIRYQQQQYHQQTLQDQHYAAGYVLIAAPPDTVINQNKEQDLAAAAMDNPPQQFNSVNLTTSSSGPMMNVGAQSNYQNHSLFGRGNFPVQQSPLHRRIGINSVQSHGQSPSVLNHLSNNNKSPIRAGHSSLSLASSTYLIEDKLQNEIKKLQKELNSEKEKNSALNSQLNINSNLMAAFEQSLTTLNTRLRQLSAMNEKKDQEIDELRKQLGELDFSMRNLSVNNTRPIGEINDKEEDSIHSQREKNDSSNIVPSEIDKNSEQNLLQIIEDLKRQLIEKDRLLTDTRLEALSAAHQLEQLESKLNGETSLLVHEDDLDEGVMVVNHSPSDSDVITDSAHFSEMNSQISKTNDHQQQYYGQNRKNINSDDMMLFTPTRTSQGNSNNSNNSTDDTSELQRNYSHQYQLQQHQHQQDSQSNHSSSDYHVEDKSSSDIPNQQDLDDRKMEHSNSENDDDAMNRLLDTMLVSN